MNENMNTFAAFDMEHLAEIKQKYKKKSQLKSVWVRFRKNKMAV